LGVSPAKQASCSGPRGSVDVADLGDEHRCQDRTDPGDGLHCAVARIVREAGPGHPREVVDLEPQGLDQPALAPQGVVRASGALHPVVSGHSRGLHVDPDLAPPGRWEGLLDEFK